MVEWLGEIFSNPYVLIVLLTFVPAFELRVSIPYGIYELGTAEWAPVVLLAIGTNIVLGPIVYFFLDKFLHLLLRIGWFKRVWDHTAARVQKKIHRKVEKYGVWGLSIFIGVPLPGSGVYSGAVGGYLLGFTFREFLVSTIVGVLIAGIIVTAITLTGTETLGFLIKRV